MSCISNNFSSFFLNSLNDSSEFAKYLSNGELKFSSFEDFQVFGSGATQQQQQQQYSTQQQQQQQLNGIANSSSAGAVAVAAGGLNNAHEVFNGAASHMESNNYAHPTLAASAAHHHQHAHQPPQSQQQQHSHLHHAHTPAPAHHPHPQHYVGHGHHHTQPPAPGVVPNNFHHNHHQHPHLAAAHHHPHLPAAIGSSGSSSSAAIPSAGPQGYCAPQRWPTAAAPGTPLHSNHPSTPHAHGGAQHFDGSFEFLKYLRHSNDFNSEPSSSGDSASASSTASTPAATTSNQQQQQQQTSSLIDLDSSTSHKSRSSRKVAALLSSVARASNSLDSCSLDVYDHDSKHTLFDLHHMTNSSNSNESSLEISNLAFPGSHLNASNSNTSSEGATAGNSDFPMLNSASNAPKPLATFAIKENFDVHPAHKVEEGIFQHMNKLPTKKKDNLKQLGVRFTGQMTLTDKSIVVENFIKFCQEYDIKDHRPFLSLNQSGLNKPEQIKFARYLGQGLPTFTLFCIYSNFKNLFCTKRTEIYTKDGYNLPYILDKTKRFLSNTTADLKNMMQQQSNDGADFPSNNNSLSASGELLAGSSNNNKCIVPKVLENLVIYENFDVHETHRIEDGVCTHITRLPPKKQEMLKQFGIQSNQTVTYYEKYMIVENFIKFCNEYKITDHRPFLDFHESGLPKSEQLKFVRYLGQGLPNLTLNKLYVAFKDVLGLNRIEKITLDGYNLDLILKKKKKNLYNRMHAAVPI